MRTLCGGWVRRTRGRRRCEARDERGIALILVMVMIGVLSVLVAAVAQDAISSSYTSRHAQDYNAAMGAAEAGVSDFLYRLNVLESSSFCVAQVVQTHTVGTGSCSSVFVVPPATAPGWVEEPGSTNSLLSCYQYSVPPTGLIQGANVARATAVLLDVVGKVTTGSSCTSTARSQRTIRVTLTRSTYLNYAYFTDVETQDPAQYSPTLSSEFSGVPNAQAYATQYCSDYYFALSNPNTVLQQQGKAPSGGVAPVAATDIRLNHSSTSSFTHYTQNNICTFTKFGGGDTFDGPIHTNDVLQFNGPSNFAGPVTVSHDNSGGCTDGYAASAANDNGRGVLWVDANAAIGAGVTPSPTYTGGISCVAPIPLPTANSSLLTEAQSGGCAYKGITYISFQASGKIDVYSPSTPPGTAGLRGACPVNGTWTPPSNFNGVIYVSNLAASTVCSLPTDRADPAPRGTVGATLGQIIRADDLNQLENENINNPAGSVNPLAYDCHNGDAFVGGTMSGAVTVGADNNDVIYQNLTYADDTGGHTVDPRSANVLGLEPQGSVQIYHPVSCPGWSTGSVAGGTEPAYTSCADNSTNLLPSPDPCPADTACQTNDVQAAILCFNGEYTAENWSYGAGLGQLQTTGSVTQRYRGRLAGTSSGSGYGKTYKYDSRLASVTPPYFLPPNIFSWSQTSFAETTADRGP